MTADLGDAELSRSVALACGWRRIDSSLWVLDGNRRWNSEIDSFATSLDACFAPGGPVEYAKAQGWEPQVSWASDIQAYEGLIVLADCETSIFRDDPDPARAFCLAFLAAVQQ